MSNELSKYIESSLATTANKKQAVLPVINTFLSLPDVIDKIEEMEKRMLSEPQIDIPPIETFVNGMYTRQIVIPKDTLLTGRVYKEPYVDIMISGDITLTTPEGVKRLKGYNVCDGNSGRKRAGYAHEDTLWITIHKADEFLDDMKKHLSFFSVNEYKAFEAQADFLNMLEHTGFTEEEAWKQSTETHDRKDVPLNGVCLKQSEIHGTGMFATKQFNSGDLIMVSRHGLLRTQGGRYINHSPDPNCKMVSVIDDIFVEAIKTIKPNKELTVDYRQSTALTKQIHLEKNNDWCSNSNSR